MVDVVSPSELPHHRDRDRRRSDLQAVEGAQEIVEIDQDEMLADADRNRTRTALEGEATPDILHPSCSKLDI